MSYHKTGLNDVSVHYGFSVPNKDIKVLANPLVSWLNSAGPCHLYLFIYFSFDDGTLPHREGKMATDNPSLFSFIYNLVNVYKIYWENSNGAL